MRKISHPNKMDKYLSQKGKHPVPKTPTKTKIFFKWLSDNWIGTVSLIVAIIALLKQ